MHLRHLDLCFKYAKKKDIEIISKFDKNKNIHVSFTFCLYSLLSKCQTCAKTNDSITIFTHSSNLIMSCSSKNSNKCNDI